MFTQWLMNIHVLCWDSTRIVEMHNIAEINDIYLLNPDDYLIAFRLTKAEVPPLV